jgi:hypothetical protein
MVFECHAEGTSRTLKNAGILCEAGFKAEQARSKGDIWQSKVFRSRVFLEDKDMCWLSLELLLIHASLS